MNIIFHSVKRKVRSNGIEFLPRATVCIITRQVEVLHVPAALMSGIQGGILVAFGISLSSPVDLEIKLKGQEEAFNKAIKGWDKQGPSYVEALDALKRGYPTLYNHITQKGDQS